MATYYARNVTGNWAANTSWDSASSGGAGPAGPPVAGDTAIFDSGFTGNISIAATAACAILTVQAGATGTLTYSSGQLLTTTGNVTFVSGFHLAGTGTHRINGSMTLTSGGLSIPAINIIGTSTITLADALSVSGALTLSAQTTFSGAFNISCDSLLCSAGGNWSQSFVAGQTLTIATSINVSGGLYTMTFKSATASSNTNIVYNGTAANCKIFNTAFTDIDASGSAVPILNWHGGTLTRTDNIYNVTSASFPAVADVKSAVEYGGLDDASANRLTGTYSASGGGGLPILGGSVVR